MHELHHGNCLDILRTMPDASVDSVVTDPPYGLSFMGKRWDYDVPSVEIWEQCLRVLKPGGYLLAFAGTRTQHRMAVRIEDAGFEIRDMIAWMYGSGFPKSLDVSKALDKAAGAKREKIRHKARPVTSGTMSGKVDTRPWIEKSRLSGFHECDGTIPVTDQAKQWQGWGTALKPAMEPITMARKPFKGTVADNVQMYGTGAINVDGCRIPVDENDPVNKALWHCKPQKVYGQYADHVDGVTRSAAPPDLGRWPANVLHDGSEDVLRGFGEAARFFYTPKACKEDRDDGCEMMEEMPSRCMENPDTRGRPVPTKSNIHPTVKPTDLMRYLCRMVTPPGGVVLDPFTGSGSTGRGAVLEGFRFIGCEMDADYIKIAKARILAAEKAYQPCLTFD